MADLKKIVKSADMSEEMQQEAIELHHHAVEKYKTN